MTWLGSIDMWWHGVFLAKVSYPNETPTYRVSLGDGGELRWIDRQEGAEVVREAEVCPVGLARLAIALG